MLGNPPSLIATVKLARLWLNWGECRTFLRIFFFCERSRDAMTASVSSGSSIEDTSSTSCAKRSNAGGKKLKRLSTVLSSAASRKGSVAAGGRRSCRVVNGLSGSWDWLEFLCKDCKKLCTTEEGSESAAALYDHQRVSRQSNPTSKGEARIEKEKDRE